MSAASAATDTVERTREPPSPETSTPATPVREVPTCREVPVRPVVAGAANLVLIAGASIYAATGPVGLAVAAGAAGMAGVGALRRAHQARRGRVLRAAQNAARTGAVPSRRGTGAARALRSAQGVARAGTAGARRARTGAQDLRRAQTRARAGTTPLRTALRSARAGTTGAHTGAQTRKALARGAARTAQAAHRTLRTARAGLRSADSPRGAARAARARTRRALRIRGARAGMRWTRGWGAALVAYAAGAVRAAWRAVVRRYRGTPAVPKSSVPEGRVADTVRVPISEQGAQETRSAVTVVEQEGVVMSETMRRMADLAEEMATVAQGSEPEGMMQVVQDYRALPDVLETVASAMRIIVDIADERYPLDPAVRDCLAAVYQAQLAAAEVAREVAPAMEAIHAVEIGRLTDPRAGEAMWDIRANGDAP